VAWENAVDERGLCYDLSKYYIIRAPLKINIIIVLILKIRRNHEKLNI